MADDESFEGSRISNGPHHDGESVLRKVIARRKGGDSDSDDE
jgi:hypothetical protein